MSLVALIRGSTTLPNGSATVSQAHAFTDIAKSMAWFDVSVPSAADNNWDSQLVMTRSVGGTQLNWERAGTTGDVTIRWKIIADTRITAQNIFNVGPFGAGQNLINIAPVDRAKAFIVPMGFTAQGSRDGRTMCRLDYFGASNTQVNAQIETVDINPRLLSFACIEFDGATVQDPLIIPSVSVDQNFAISAVDLARTCIFTTSASGSAAYLNSEVFTCDLSSPTNARYRRFSQVGSSALLASHIVQFPPDIRVQRFTSLPTIETDINNTVVKYNTARAAALNGSSINAPYVMAEATALNGEADRCSWRTDETPNTNVNQHRSQPLGNAMIAGELLEWLLDGNPGAAGIMQWI